MAPVQRIATEPLPARSVIDLTPFAVEPPQLGGQVIIRSVNKALAALGQPVEQFSMGVRRADLVSVGRPRRIEIAPGYIEWRRTEPVSLLLFLMTVALRIPHVWAGRALALRPWPQLKRAMAGCRAVLVEMPWAFAPGEIVPPRGAPLVYMSQNAEYQLAADWRGRWAGLGKWLADELERQEARVLGAADLTICITPEDRSALLAHYPAPPDRLHVLPRGLDLDRYPILTPDERRQQRQALGLGDEVVLVFSGSYHPPNFAAAQFAQALAANLPDHCRVIIAGTVARHLPERADPRVWLRPDPTAPAQLLPLADIGLNPMTTGSGMNVKMLEYLAWGLPVVTTPWGARGIEGEPGSHFLIAELVDMASHISRLAADPALRMSLGMAGRQLVSERYSAELTARQLLHLLDNLRCDPPKLDAL